MTAISHQFHRPLFSTLPVVGLFDEEFARPDSEPAHTREVTYCPGLEGKRVSPHKFTVTMFFDAEVPLTWDCRKHGVTATTKVPAKKHKPSKGEPAAAKAKTSWDMLLMNHPDESRGDIILAGIMARMRTGGYPDASEWLQVSQRRRNADPAPAPRRRARVGPAVAHHPLP